ncbi:MAG TPA: flagellar basal body P-ring protein FlgI [Terriglobales bacterium]|nr:flagellar basal body P-ring protein FlgI [Terriglobales bacterium]
MRRVWCLIFAGFLVLPAVAQEGVRVLIRDIASFEGVRENSLIGYGLVAGLKNTGDSQQTVFTNQTLANVLLRMGIQVTGPAVRVNNVAAVFVTASLPPFARSGTRLDVTVSSVGDAKSLEGGMLLLTTLRGPDGQVYATAQGPLTIGGFAASATGNVKQVNHPTVARIPAGAIVERDAPNNIDKLPTQRLLLASEDFSVAQEIAAAINTELNDPVASALDAGRVEILTKAIPAQSLPVLLARIETLPLTIHPRAKVVVNERTGTVVIGRQVKLGAVSVLQGNLSVQISTEVGVSQPAPFSQGQTRLIEQSTVHAEESKARRVELREGATVDDLVTGLQAIGATTRDVISILQAIKAAGALRAELEVI